MNKKLFVGGLSYQTTEDGLCGYFNQIGEVESTKVIFDRETGRSKGFGFVEMVSAADAQTVIQEYNGQEFEGRSLTINEARPQTPRAPRGGNNDW
jgi:RNA recognition motif-containing protein